MDLHPYLEPYTLPSSRLWHILATSGEHPAVRVGHACVHVPGTGQSNGLLFVTGGANPSGTFSDMFALDLDSFTWHKFAAGSFAGRYEHTAFRSLDDPTRFYVFGGADCNGNRNDVQEYNITTDTWTTLDTVGVSPSARTFHNGACIGNQLIVYGGGDQGAVPVMDKNTYAFNIVDRQWSVLKLNGDAPKPRHGHLMVGVGNRLFLHGGMSHGSFFDDLHILDLDKNNWSCAKIKSIKPERRAAHGGFASGVNVFLFGGMNGTGALNNMFFLNTETMQWSAIELAGSVPESRLDFATCMLPLQLPIAIPAPSSVPCIQHSSTAQLTEKSSDSEAVGSVEAESAHIIDVTNDFTSPIGIVNVAGKDSKEIAASTSPVASGSVITSSSVTDTELSESIGNIHIDAAASPVYVDIALVLGGMDTEGEIFDDCLAFRLSN